MRREITRVTRTEKRKHMARLIDQTEEEHHRGNSRSMFQSIQESRNNTVILQQCVSMLKRET